MSLFGKKKSTKPTSATNSATNSQSVGSDQPGELPPVPRIDRRGTGRWMQPGRCPKCGSFGQVVYIDRDERTARHECRECDHEWQDSEADEQERFESYRRRLLEEHAKKNTRPPE